MFENCAYESTTVTSLWVRVFYIPKTPVCLLGCQIHHDPRWFLQEGPKLRYYEATNCDGEDGGGEDEFFSMVEIPGTQKHLGVS